MAPPEFPPPGLCAQADPELFSADTRPAAEQATAICRRCPVQAECLEYALTHDERFGILGGTTGRERQRLREDRALPTAAERERAAKRAAARRMHAAGRSKASIGRLLRLSGATLNTYLAEPTAGRG